MKRPNKEELKEASPEVLMMVEEADKLQSIKALAETEGGKELVELLMTDVVSCINQLRSSYRTLPHTELIALCVTLDERLALVQMIGRAKESLKSLDEAIAEALSE